MSNNWFKLSRELLKSDLWKSEKFTRGQAWIDMIGLANYKPRTIRIRGVKVIVDRGQIGHTISYYSTRWGWSKGKILRFFSELKKDEMIVQQKCNVTTLFTIRNYDEYQSDGTEDGTPNGTPNGIHKKKVKESKEVKEKEKEKEKIFVLPDYVDQDSWDGYMLIRKKLKLATTGRSLTLLLNKIQKFHDDGVDVNAALDRSTECEYKSIFAPNGEARNARYNRTLPSSDQVRESAKRKYGDTER